MIQFVITMTLLGSVVHSLGLTLHDWQLYALFAGVITARWAK